ncbi:MAG: aminotransferase class V-fold PLP-dependent enzyme [Gemmatimonadota bacterium]
MQPAYDIAALRKQIPILGSMIPMNNCSQAPQTVATRAAAERYLESWNTYGMDWDSWMDEVRAAKVEFASLIGAAADEIAIFSSVSEATSAVASALEFTGARRKILVSEAEFPTVGQVWLAQERRGARIEWAPLHEGAVDPSEYDLRIDRETLIVSACHGFYLNGALQDIKRIATQAHEHGALLLVDAYQSLGAVPVDVKALDVDFLVSGNLKFLMGAPGVAFLYVREALIGNLHPTVTGWFGRENPFAFQVNVLDWSPSASRFDTGTPPIINVYIARAGMEIINELGVEHIRRWHEVLAHRLIERGRERGLQVFGPTDVAHKTASTAFTVDDSHAVENAMRERGIIPSARGQVIRLAPHYYNTLDDVDTAVDVLAAVTHAR